MAYRKKFYRKKKTKHTQQPEGEMRVRMPREGEIFGIVEALHGGKRMTVRCADGKKRMARVPGKLKRIFVRAEDIVLIKPWPVEGHKKADIAFRYRRNEVEWLDKRGYLKDL